jgi:hypothetical protein
MFMDTLSDEDDNFFLLRPAGVLQDGQRVFLIYHVVANCTSMKFIFSSSSMKIICRD